MAGRDPATRGAAEHPLKNDAKRPTDAELMILKVLWDEGPCTVRQVHGHLAEYRDVGQTTILKLMQIMKDKGILKRDETVRPQIFRPARTESRTQRQLLSDLVEKAFGGSPGSLVMQMLSSRKTTTEERKLIREMLDRLEEGER